MGSCISKCRPKRKFKEDYNCVQDKLVISQAPLSPPIPVPTFKKLPHSPSPISSSYLSSYSGATSSSTSSGSSMTSSLSSSSSCSSSILSSKDRSYSNEFLRSCVKENPHVISLDTIKGSLEKSAQNRVDVHNRKLSSPGKSIVAAPKQPVAERPSQSTPHKRPRSNSPTFTGDKLLASPGPRQKSFRKEPEKPISSYALHNKVLRSPSPSRTYINGDYCRGALTNTQKMSYIKRSIGSKENGVDYVRRENLRPASPNNNVSRYHSSLRNNTNTYKIGSKIDEIAVAAAVSSQNMDPIPMEDIDNPLIALDCFIFL